MRISTFFSIGVLTTIAVASSLAQGVTNPKQEKVATSAPVTKAKPVVVAKPKPVKVNPPQVSKTKPADANKSPNSFSWNGLHVWLAKRLPNKPAQVVKTTPAPDGKKAYPVKTNPPQVAKAKPAPVAKPVAVAKPKPVPSVKAVQPVKVNPPQVAKTKPVAPVKPVVVAKSKPAPAIKPAPTAKPKVVEAVVVQAAPRELTKSEKLAALLESYKANAITPVEYHERRAQLQLPSVN